MNIKIPKIELHVHLAGSIRISTISELADITLEEAQKRTVAPLFNNSNDEFMAKLDLSISIMQTKENLKRIAKEFAEDLKNDNVIYAEVRLAPSLHQEKDLTLDEVIDSVLEGFREVDIKANLILSMLRNESDEYNKKIIQLAKIYLGKGVVALDLEGKELLNNNNDFKKLFDLANTLGIPYTIHAGETDDWSNILSAIEFGAKRIGHGVKAIENKSILELIKQKDILLEICPTSNVQKGIARSISAHPINSLKKMGIKMSINTDNRTLSFIDLEKEYKNLANSFKYDIKEFCKFNRMAIESSFLSKNEKSKLNIIIDEYLKQFS